MSLRIIHRLASCEARLHLLYRTDLVAARLIDNAHLLPILRDAVSRAASDLQLRNFHILVYVDPAATIPEEGIGGHALTETVISLTLDPRHPKGIDHNLTQWLAPTITHELHHVRRMRTVGYGRTLGEVLVTEGLACAYEESVFPKHYTPYAHALSSPELRKAWKGVQAHLQSSQYNHGEWFYGTGKIKRWAGYALGYDIVQKYLLRHPEETPVTLVDSPAQVLLQEY